MSSQWDPAGLFEVLASKESRRILAAASVRPVSAKELETVCESSLPTIYRRLNVLVEYDLLSEEQVVDPAADRSKQYSTDLREVTVEIDDGDFDVNVTLKKDTVDRFGELFRDLGEGQRGETSTGRSEFSFESPTEE